MSYTPSLSDLPSEPVQAGNQTSGYQPSLADLPPETNIPNQRSAPGGTDVMGAVNQFNAVGGGVASALANVPQAIGDATTFIAQHLHAISPETAAKLYEANKQNSDLLRPRSNSIPAQAMAENPGSATAGKFLTNAGMMTLGMGATEGLGAGASELVPSIPTIAGGVGRALGLGLVGSSVADPEDKGKSFLINAALSPAFDLAGYGAQQIGKRASAIEDLGSNLSNFSKEQVKGAYSKIQEMPFSPEDKVSLNGVADRIQQQLASIPDGMASPTQKRILSSAAENLQNVSSHADSLKIVQALGKESSKNFSGVKVMPQVRDIFETTKADLESSLNSAAIRNEIPDAITNATNLNQINKVSGKIFKGFSEDPLGFKVNNTVPKLNQAIEKYKQIPGMNQTVQALQGMRKLAIAAKPTILGDVIKNGAGASIGGYYGYEKTGTVEGGIIGAAAGATISKLTLTGLSKLADSPQGQAMLRSLANPGVNLKDAGNVLKAIITGFTSTGTNSLSSSPTDEQNQ